MGGWWGRRYMICRIRMRRQSEFEMMVELSTPGGITLILHRARVRALTTVVLTADAAMAK